MPPVTWWTPKTTTLLIAFSFVFYVILDVWLAARVGNDATLSKRMQWIGAAWPIVIVAWGGLSCHFFVPKYSTFPGWWAYLKPVFCLLAGFVAFAVAWQQMAPEE